MSIEKTKRKSLTNDEVLASTQLLWNHNMSDKDDSQCARESSSALRIKANGPRRAAALDDYLRRWRRWTTAGFRSLTDRLTFPTMERYARETEAE
jgi:hypothetical protein